MMKTINFPLASASVRRPSARSTPFSRRLALGFLALSGAASLLSAGTVPEPDTLLYGRIVNHFGGAHEFVSSGVLSWSVQLSDGETTTLTTRLEPMKGNLYSYQLRIPHSLVGAGLAPSPESLPLAIDPKPYGFAEILVNGSRATVADGSANAVSVSQTRRAQAIRIDLELREPMLDSDSDGLPDWWEDAYGLDRDSAADALGDLDGDGLTNRAEFLAGLSPAEDNRRPSLGQADFSVYPVGRSGLALRVVDTDSAPDNIRITVTGLPATGTLVLRNGEGGRILGVGDYFTAADAALGLLEFRRDADAEAGEPPSQATAAFVLADTPDGVDGVAETVRMNFFSPKTEEELGTDWATLADTARIEEGESGRESLRAKADLYARHGGSVVWDLLDSLSGVTLRAVSGSATRESYAEEQAASFGDEPPVILLGGGGADELAGGYGDDILFGGPGSDDLTGNRGADRFVVDLNSDADRIMDFTPGEGDQLDLTRLIRGSSMVLEDYLRVTLDGEGQSALEIVSSGMPGGEPSVVVRLKDYPLTPDALVDLVGESAILVGNLSATPLLSLERVSDAGENDLLVGTFLVRRAGSVQATLTAQLAISGSAANGVDYQFINSTLVFPAGVRELPVEVRPYHDALDENAETVRLELLAGDGYRVAESASAAELVIGDLEPMLSLELFRPEASFAPRSSALILLNREGMIDRQIIVRLRWTGPAALAVLEALPNYLELAKGETSRIIEINPLTNVAVPGQALSLELQILEQSSYLLGARPAARVAVVPATVGFGDWVSADFELNGQDAATLAETDPGRHGVPLLSRFAFGLSANRPDLRSSALPRAVLRDGRPGVEFVLEPGRSGVAIEVETSSDLSHWSSDASLLREVYGDSIQSRPVGWRRFEAVEPDATPNRLFRVQLRLEP